jgi:3-hydroxyisobutyrate dehydrogenase-like beta-hydroxyacid dehydrogenase
MSNSSPKTVGVVGLGLLGSALAECFHSSGFEVLGFDVDSNRRSTFRRLKRQTAKSSIELAHRVKHIVFSLPDSDVVDNVLSKIETHLQPETIVIDTTTGDPHQISKFGPRLAARNVFYLDSTVGGSSTLVRNREALVFVGGVEKAFHASQKIFAAFSRQVFYLGESGSGAQMKLVFNLALGLHRAVLAEALHFATTSGIAPAMALEILQAGVAYSRVMDTKGRKMVEGDFEPEARLTQHLKDVRLMLKVAERNGTSLPLSRLHRSLLETAERSGLGEADNSALIKIFATLNDHDKGPR